MAKGQKTGGGSRAGIPNRITATLKDMILAALDKAGGEEYLIEQAHKNPVAFMSLIARVLPLEVAGGGGGPLIISWERAEPKPDR
jgi:hypothetical protein